MDTLRNFAALQDWFVQHNEETMAVMWKSPTPMSLQQQAVCLLPKFQGLEIIVLLSGMC